MEEQRRVKYRYVKVQGNAFEAGRQLGQMMKKNHELIKMLTTPFPGQRKLSGRELECTMNVFEQTCPGINDEIKGFAEGAGVNAGDVIYYFAYIRTVTGECSLIAIPPEISECHEGLLARNYEFAWDDNSVLIESNIDGQYRQIGFGCQMFGRFDGMNEYGLCIATAAGVIQPQYSEEGFVFPVIIRAILNQCKTVDEALQLYDKIKVADYRNFMIIDAYGDSALIEAAASNYVVTRSDNKYDKKVLYATNHYESEELKEKRFYEPRHSLARYDAIRRVLGKEKNISASYLKELMSSSVPDGLCCHYYNDGMGTMWSIVFHPEKRIAEICFGSPDKGEWRNFVFNDNIEDKEDISEYEVTLCSEAAPDGFWDDCSQDR